MPLFHFPACQTAKSLVGRPGGRGGGRHRRGKWGKHGYHTGLHSVLLFWTFLVFLAWGLVVKLMKGFYIYIYIYTQNEKYPDLYLRSCSGISSLPEMSSDRRKGIAVVRSRREETSNCAVCTVMKCCPRASPDTSRCLRWDKSHKMSAASSLNGNWRLCSESDLSRSLHFFSGEMSEMGVLEISRLSRHGRSSAMISNPCLLNSV